MIKRDGNFYDFIGKGLAAMGFTGNGFEQWINYMFAEKYNADETFSQMGFPLSPEIPINPTYEQIEATIRPYTMGAYVDIDSDGPTKSTDGFTLKMGKLPTFKHEISLSRKTIRERMLLADALGGVNAELAGVIMEQLFNAVDKLIGGNYNTIAHQRHQIVSNGGKLVVDATNNPMGVPFEIDFGVPKKNTTTSVWYTRDGETLTQAEDLTDGKIDPIRIMRDIRRNASEKDFMPQGHWEVDRTTYEDLIALPYFRQTYSLFYRPDITDKDQMLAYGNLIEDSTVKTFIEGRIGASIQVVDSIGSVEKYDSKLGKMGYTNIRSFKEGVMVFVPDGPLGDVQCGKPVYMDTPGSRNALYDGGRTLIRQVFNDENMVQTVKSEVTALVVPNKVRWFYYLNIKG